MSDPARLFPEPIGWPLLAVPGEDGGLSYPSLAQSVREQIQIILSTRPGEQLMRPSYGGGLENLLAEPNTVATRSRIHDLIEEALARWEPRIAVESVDVAADPADPESAIATITYKLVASQKRERVSVNVALAPS